jgi:hypothetical protein
MTPTKMRRNEMADLFQKASPDPRRRRNSASRARRLPRLAFTSDGWIDFQALRAVNASTLDGTAQKKGAGHGKNRKILNSTEAQGAF